MPERKRAKKEGFTAEEKAAMKARARELKSKEDGEGSVPAGPEAPGASGAGRAWRGSLC